MKRERLFGQSFVSSVRSREWIEVLLFSPVGWEDTLGGHYRPQSKINEELVECDYFVLVLWDRWGSPTDIDGQYSSGCDEEFNLALECLTENRPMKEVIVPKRCIRNGLFADCVQLSSRLLKPL